MRIDIELIEKAFDRMQHVAKVVIDERYSMDYTVSEIRQASTLLQNLNVVTEEQLALYRSTLLSWANEMDERRKPLEQYIKELDRIKEIDYSKEEGIEELEAIFQKYDNPEMEKSIMGAFEFDINKFRYLLAQDLNIKLANERRWILLFTDYGYRFRYPLVKFISALTSFIITTGFSLLLGLVFSQISDVIIAFLIFLFSYFTLEKLLGNWVDLTIKETTKMHVLTLHQHFKVYTDQIKLLTDFLRSRKP